MGTAIEENDPFQILEAIAFGADRNELLHAVSFANVVCVELLIKNGAKLTGKDIRDWTCLHYAAFQNDIPALKLLLQRGANMLINEKDVDGLTPLDIVKLKIKTITENGKEIHTEGKDTPQAVQDIIKLLE